VRKRKRKRKRKEDERPARLLVWPITSSRLPESSEKEAGEVKGWVVGERERGVSECVEKAEWGRERSRGAR
jgi:hypothetical protein